MKVAFDLDGTLAQFDRWRGEDHIGEPIPEMVQLAKEHMAKGDEVVIFTARYGADIIPPILQWCVKHLGRVVDVTNVKTADIERFYDDRAVAVHLGKDPVVQRLMAVADTFVSRNSAYKANYKTIGNLLIGLFEHAGGFPSIRTPEEAARLNLVISCLAKLQRYCANFPTGGHKDSAHDLTAYAAMLEEVTKP